MMRRTLAAALLVSLASAPLAAEVKYTMRMELKKGSGAAPAPNPMLDMIGRMVTEMIVPGGTVDVNVVMGDRGTRVEANKAMSGLPAGSVMLQRPDGSMVVMDPPTKTYWKSGPVDVTAIQATTTRTGEFSTLAGERVERVIFRFEVPLGADAAAAGMRALTIEGEAWVAEKYQAYTTLTAKAGVSPGGMGLRQLAELGLSMRQVMRSTMFGGQEIESVVTKIAEEAVPATLFDVPADFREVRAPGKVEG